jgi:hypothetical protein
VSDFFWSNVLLSSLFFTHASVVDLLINLLCAAASGPAMKGWNRNGNGLPTGYGARANNNFFGKQQQQQSFEPFPWRLGFDDGRTQNVGLLLETCDLIPSVSVLNTYATDEQLLVELNDISPLVFPLLRWIVCSSRPHLTLIPKKKEMPPMKSALQFQMVTSSPEHEEKFLSWKQSARLNNQRKSRNNFGYQGVRAGFRNYAGRGRSRFVAPVRGGFLGYGQDEDDDEDEEDEDEEDEDEEEEAEEGGPENTRGRNGSYFAFHGR